MGGDGRWWNWLLLFLGPLWMAVGFSLFVWAKVRAWRWRRSNPKTGIEQDIHGGEGAGWMTGCVLCLCWPLILVIIVYERLRYPRR